MQKVVLSWSGGKDSAMALDTLRKDPEIEITALLTTVTAEYERISMHGVRRPLLEAQAAAAGLPLDVIEIPPAASNGIYESKMEAACLRYKDLGVSAIAFGDLYLADVRKYREDNLAKVGLLPLFPVWGIPTQKMSRAIIDGGFRAVLTCVDTRVLDSSFAGREYDNALLDDLPPGIDPCAENGEFHTFVYQGPIFSKPVRFSRGEKILRDQRFMYCDLIPE
jgi:uncharacterized protein (TIGR00290 family)